MNNTRSFPSNDLAGLHKLRGLIIDMDGVLWQGDLPLPGLHDFFEVLRQREIKFVLATNNNTQTPDGFVLKARQLGVEIMSEQVVTASIATVRYLRLNYPPGSRIYVVSEAPLKCLITEAGFTLIPHTGQVVHVVIPGAEETGGSAISFR